jgi:hypothetical protein
MVLVDNAHVKWRLLVWTAAVIATGGAVGLGADIVLAGVNKSAGFAGVIAGFCELAAFALGVAGWAGGRRAALAGGNTRDTCAVSAPAEPSHAASRATEGDAKYTVDARGAQGVQIGDNSFQHNDFRRASPGRGPRTRGR